MNSRRAAFWKPSAWALLLALAGYAVAAAILGYAHKFGSDRTPELGFGGGLDETEFAADLGRIVLPSAKFSPCEVVQTQLDGLARPGDDGIGVLQCFIFASPGNRAATGPLERFAGMVRTPPYNLLGMADAVLVGQPQIDGEMARVLVTLVSPADRIGGFTFILRRQRQGKYQDCWMTESVLPLVNPAPKRAGGEQPDPKSPSKVDEA